MRPTTLHLTALSRWVAPTPMIEAEMTCVVESGMPKCAGHVDHGGRGRLGGEAVDRLQLDHVVAERLDDPPAAGGRAGGHGQRADHLDPDGDRRTRGVCEEAEPAGQVGERRRPGSPVNSARAMMPMVFCASLVPWLKPMNAGADELQLAEDRVDAARPPVATAAPAAGP